MLEVIESIGLLAGFLILVPVMGATTALVVGAIWSVCQEPQPPKWQAYCWYLAIGVPVRWALGLMR